MSEDQQATLITKFEKNGMEEVRVSLIQYRGKDLFDIRVYYQDVDEWKPSKKDICLSRGLFSEFRKAILDLGEALKVEEK